MLLHSFNRKKINHVYFRDYNTSNHTKIFPFLVTSANHPIVVQVFPKEETFLFSIQNQNKPKISFFNGRNQTKIESP